LSSSKLDLPVIKILLHVVIGGAICLLLTNLIYAFLQTSIESVLINYGNIGVLVFDEAVNAVQIFAFGLAYLPSCFVGGLYTGYKIKKNLRIVLVLPGIIGFALSTLFGFLSGGLNLTSTNFARNIVVPLMGSVIGSYLGGYTMNWPLKKEGVEEAEQTELNLEEQ